MNAAPQHRLEQQKSRPAAEPDRTARSTSDAFFVDHRPEAMEQRALIETIHTSPVMVAQRKQFQGMFGNAAQLKGAEDEELQMKTASDVLQRKGPEEEELLQGKFQPVQCAQEEEEELLQGEFAPVQRQASEEDELLQGKFETAQRQGPEEEELLQGKFAGQAEPAQLKDNHPRQENRTGMPDQLKSGIESLSGLSMDHVRVHYNSSQPAQLNALAYTQGTDIHVAPGQEKHLAHEAWHVVQQAQGRVRPTMQMKDGVPVNDDAGLEHEADTMGTKAAQLQASDTSYAAYRRPTNAVEVQAGRAIVQRLAHDQPIAHGEVASVERKGGKLVFVLEGGNHGRVVVKFETFNATENLEQFGSRSEALRSIAAAVLQNVPGSSPLTLADMDEIAQIPGNGGDVGLLKGLATGIRGGQQGYERLLAIKLEHIDVGQDIQALVNNAANAAAPQAGAMPAGAERRARRRPAQAPAAAPLIPADAALWQEFGRMAAFDLLVSNNDRFKPEGVNLENVSLRGAQGVSLDVVDSNSPLLKAYPWAGENILRAPDQWAQGVVGQMCDDLHMPPLQFQILLNAFLTGFIAARTYFKGQQDNYRNLGPRLAGRGRVAAGNVTYSVLAQRLKLI